MSRVVYVNGRYAPLHDPLIAVQDRGYQFADAVYEVWPVRHGRLLDREAHLLRLARSLGALSIPRPMSDAALLAAIKETLRRNRVQDGIAYLQISRGVARTRDHAFPAPQGRPTVVITATQIKPAALHARAAAGVKAITVPDLRWGRCDIKTVGLLPNALARQAAKEAGAVEALFVDADGAITEGAATNVFIVDADGVLRTRDLSHAILHGVTRAAIIKAAEELQLRVVEGPFTVAQAKAAREVFLTSAGMAATAVVAIDGAPIGDGEPGPMALKLRTAYLEAALAAAKRTAAASTAGASVADSGAAQL